MFFQSAQATNKVKATMLATALLLGSPAGLVHANTVLPDFASIVQSEGDAVVNIAVSAGVTPTSNSQQPDFSQLPEQYRKYFEQLPPQQRGVPRAQSGVGSGFIISDDGYILTNAHVVDNAASISVKLQDRREFEATLIGSDELTDVALLKVEASSLPIVTTADSDEVAVGEWVLAIGSPFGFDQTATQGIVSAASRNLPSTNYVPFIQTDVAVNPGNSGGPLFNTSGEVIGINSQIYSSTGGYQGLSFAIPINLAMSVADQLKEFGKTQRGWLGVGIQDVTPELAESFGLNEVTGALISSVSENSPADKANLREGDIILSFNGKAVERSSELPSLVGTVQSGQSVDVEVFRDGSSMNIAVIIGALGQDPLAKATQKQNVLGMQLSELDAAQLEQAGIESGVLVDQVNSSGLAQQAGVQAGDIVIQLNGKAVRTAADLQKQAAELPTDRAVSMLVKRGERSLFLTLEVPATLE